jgi:hypothetical protein
MATSKKLKFKIMIGYRFLSKMLILTFLLPFHYSECILASSLGGGDLTILHGTVVNNLGNIVVKGNFINNGTPFIGSGAIKFAGSSLQSIQGQNIFTHLEINNIAGVTIDGPSTVYGTLTLTNGLVLLGENNLQLGPSANVSGIPGSSKMIVATGSGELRKQFSGNGTFLFPVGNSGGSNGYSPVELNFTSGTYGTGNWVGVNLVNQPYPGSTESYLNRYWNIEANGISGFNCTARFIYVSPSDIVGNENDIYCVKVNPDIVFDKANTSLHQLSANGLSYFGTFTGRLGFRTLNFANIILEGLYDGEGSMRKAQDEWGDHFSGDTADIVNVELHKASDYSSIKYVAPNIGLNTAGNLTIPIPATYNERYYITIKHRNSIETTTADSISFGSGVINYSFDVPEKAYGNNLNMMLDGIAVIYTGDENQDGIIDGSDLSDLENFASAAASGYIPQDINGDGLVDGSDLSIAGNNAALAIGLITP